jgi:hypothetical protein
MNKPLMRVGFTDYFPTFDEFFLDVLSLRFDIVRDDVNPDYLLFCDETFGKNNLNYNNTVKIFFTGENRRPWNYRCNNAITFDHLDGSSTYRLPLYVVEDWVMTNKFGFKPVVDLPRDTELSTKTGFCGYVASNGGCQERNDIFHFLSKYKKVDSGGPLFNNIGYVLPREPNDKLTKIDFFKTKKFSLCYENSSYPGYVTEKLYHGFYANTVPIYWGSPVVELDFNPKAFVSRHDFGSDEEMLKKIVEIDNDDDLYMKMIREPMFNPRNKVMNLDRLADYFVKHVYKGNR